jgi:multiple sugar transport system permease protein
MRKIASAQAVVAPAFTPQKVRLPVWHRRSTFAVLFIAPAVSIVAALTIYPFLFTLIASFRYWYLPMSGLQNFVGLQNYLGYLTDSTFWHSLWLTVIFVTVTVAAELVLGMALALLLHSPLVWGAKLLRGLIIIPIMVTPVVNAVIWTIAYNYQFGFVNYMLRQVGLPSLNWLSDPRLALPAVMVPDIWQWSPFVALVVLAGLQAVRDEPYDAARIDGAGAWQLFRFITLPAIRSVLVIVTILRILFAYRVFDTIYVLTLGGPGTVTEVLSIKLYLSAFNDFMIGQASALAFIILIIAVALATLFVGRAYRERDDGLGAVR